VDKVGCLCVRYGETDMQAATSRRFGRREPISATPCWAGQICLVEQMHFLDATPPHARKRACRIG
ncbi:MAG: hypothetical protein AAFW82_02950, partial [Pseudomonadota bacterium]